MARFLLLRALRGAGTLLGVSALTFLIVFRMPADPAALLAGPTAPPSVVQNIRDQLRLDDPLWKQYGAFLARLSRGDLGTSYITRRPVGPTILERFPATLQLAGTGWLLWITLGVLLGVWTALRPTPAREGTLLGLSILAASTPTFWVGILLLYVFVAKLGLFPAGGSGTLRHLVLPVASLAVAGIPYYARLTYAGLTTTLQEDYIRTALAKGLDRRTVLFRHALRNALLPLVSLAGVDLAALLGGVVFTEAVFAWRGIGQLAVESVGLLDLPMILGVVLFSTVLVVLANLAVDLLYPVLDPRIRSR
jgi:peptide/nickel transport system permease protein